VHGFLAMRQGEPSDVSVRSEWEKPARYACHRTKRARYEWNYSAAGSRSSMMAMTRERSHFRSCCRYCAVPIGMKHSTYVSPLPATMGLRYSVQRRWHAGAGERSYPEMAAAGLWTTDERSCTVVIENQHRLRGKRERLIIWLCMR